MSETSKKWVADFRVCNDFYPIAEDAFDAGFEKGKAELDLAVATAVNKEGNDWNRSSKTYEWRRDRLAANRAAVKNLEVKS